MPPCFVDSAFESHRTVMAAFSKRKPMKSRYKINHKGLTFRLTIRAQERWICAHFGVSITLYG